jgi:hypothetical protein
MFSKSCRNDDHAMPQDEILESSYRENEEVVN